MQRHRMKTTVGGQRLPYSLHVPKAHLGNDRPLLLFLHGAGERGTYLTEDDPYGPIKVLNSTPVLQTSFMLMPECPADGWWRSDALYQLLQEVLSTHGTQIDKNRLYITGLSMGGYGTWKFLADHPDLFAAAVPVCGGGDPETLIVPHSTIGAEPFDYGAVAKITTTRVWAFHGDADPVVPVSESRRLINILRQHGNPEARLTEYPDVTHDSWTQTYADQRMYEWLFEQ